MNDGSLAKRRMPAAINEPPEMAVLLTIIGRETKQPMTPKATDRPTPTLPLYIARDGIKGKIKLTIT